jgi:hypothetical protein
MKYTLLEMTQRILGSMGSDEVNSYSDTVESSDVAQIIRETYWYLVGRMDLPANHNVFQLDASGDSTKPVLMTRPSTVLDIDYIKYSSDDENGDTEFKEIMYLPLNEFLERTLTLKESETNVGEMTLTINSQDFQFKFRNDLKPTYYTTIDDETIIFDSYDSSVDTTLTSAKTLCYGKLLPTFTMSDTFTPDLDAEQFQLLLNEAKTQAFFELKQVENAQSNERARKSFISTQRTKHSIPSARPAIERTPNYGRSGPSVGRRY